MCLPSFSFLRPIEYRHVSRTRLRFCSVLWLLLTLTAFRLSFAWIYSNTSVRAVPSSSRTDESCVPQNDLPPLSNACTSSSDADGTVRLGRRDVRGFARELSTEVFHDGLKAPLLRNRTWYGQMSNESASLVSDLASLQLDWSRRPRTHGGTTRNFTTQQVLKNLPSGVNDLLIDGVQPCLAPVVCYDTYRKSVLSTFANALSITTSVSFTIMTCAQSWLGNNELRALLPRGESATM